MSAPASAVLETTVTIPALIGIPGPQGPVGPQGPPGATYSFIVAGNSGPSQTINNGNTLTLASPVSFQQVVMSATDTATLEWPVQVANTFLSGPNTGVDATPTFRAVVVADIATALNTGGVPAIFTNLTVNGNTILGDNSADTVTFNASTVALSASGLNFDSNTFFIDSANNRVSIGTTTFTAAGTVLQISGNRVDMLAATTTMFMRLTNSSSALMEMGTTSTRGYFESSQALAFRVNGSDGGGILTGREWIMGVPSTDFTPSYRVHAARRSALTNAIDNVFAINHNSSGTPAAGFGSRMAWQLESSTTENRDAAALDVLWTTATDATRTSRMDFYTVNSGTLTLSAAITPTGIKAINGALATPSIAFDNDSNTGLYSFNADQLGVSCGGILAARFLTTGIGAGPTGSAAQPSFHFSADTDTGFYRITTNSMGFVAGGIEVARMTETASAPMIGFLGAAAVIRQALGAWAGLTDAQKLDALRDALTNLGLTSYT